jgi:hypothetical protein
MKNTNDATSANTDTPGQISVRIAAFQLAVGVFGAAIVLIYPVGFITLWVQIMDTYGYDISDAFYATSMVPTNVVAGQAVFVLVYAPIAANILGLAYLGTELLKDKPSLMQRTPLFVAITIAVLVISIIVIGYFFSRVKATVFTIGLCVLIYGGLAMLYDPLTEAHGPRTHTHSIRGAIPLVVSGLITGVCMNILFYGLELPTIELQKKSSDDSVEGILLSHTDGFWHLINSSQPKHPLIAVPNERVSKVKIAEQ